MALHHHEKKANYILEIFSRFLMLHERYASIGAKFNTNSFNSFSRMKIKHSLFEICKRIHRDLEINVTVEILIFSRYFTVFYHI